MLFANKPFVPHSLFNGGHAQTLAAFAWPRRRRYKAKDEERIFNLPGDIKLLGHCRWQSNRLKHPTIIIWHGIEGSSASTYMLSTAHKAFVRGFNVIRMNLRSCGGTEHLAEKTYHGGLTEDLRFVVSELIEHDGLARLFLVGFSLGGNLVLKLAGEYGDDAPKEVIACGAVSPSVDLQASAQLIMKRSNWLYHRDFVHRLKQRAERNRKLFSKQWDRGELRRIRTIREFDDQFTARAHGFNGVDDYYNQSSSLRVIERIQIPTLIIHAEDDPFIPFAPLRNPAVTENPNILLIATERGGHVAFISAKPQQLNYKLDDTETSVLSTQHSALPAEDRFWAENRVIEFCALAESMLAVAPDGGTRNAG